MGLYLKKRLDDSSFLGVWRITESVEQLEKLVTPEQLVELNRYQNSKRKKEKLAARVLLNHLAGKQAKITYSTNGKPELANRPYNISISHSGDYVAIIVSYKSKVGIDIQYISDKIYKVLPRFMHPEEYQNIHPYLADHSIHLHWCAKETLYKLHGKGNLNWTDQMRVTPFDVNEAGKMKGLIQTDSEFKEYELNYAAMDGNYIMVWAAN